MHAMISKQDLDRIIQREDGGRPVLSLFLDMSVDSTNKRHHTVFLAQKRAQLAELNGERNGGRLEDLAAALDRVDDWLGESYEESNRGVVIYTEVGGGWFEAFQFPVSVHNRMAVAERPVIAPLAQILESYDHYGVVLLDREHVRLLSVYLGTLLDEMEFRGDPIPTPHDVQAGGYSHARFQRRKLEEMKHFFKEFAEEVDRFVKRHQPKHLVLLGTESNVAKFREFLPDSVLQLVIYTGPMAVDDPVPEVLQKLEPHLRAERERGGRALIDQVRDRAAQDYLATAGLTGTLFALQEGKVETLVVARDQQTGGARCGKCGFVFASDVVRCPYDGSDQMEGVDAIEEMVRMAEEQGVQIAFAEANEVSDLRGAGALLRF
jgi:peptide chain release factor subunit 1